MYPSPTGITCPLQILPTPAKSVKKYRAENPIASRILWFCTEWYHSFGGVSNAFKMIHELLGRGVWKYSVLASSPIACAMGQMN